MSTTTFEADVITAPAEMVVLNDVHIGVIMMDADMARQLVKNINGRFEWCRRDLLELHDKQGWKALGYSSWGACARAEFGSGAATLYRQLEAAMIERDVLQDSQLENPTPIPTAQLQAVKQLAPADRSTAFKRADQIAGEEKRTSAHVQQAAAEISAPIPPADLPPEYAIVQRRLAAHGVTLSTRQQGARLYFVMVARQGVESSTLAWHHILDQLELLDEIADSNANGYAERAAAEPPELPRMPAPHLPQHTGLAPDREALIVARRAEEMERSRANRIARDDPAYAEEIAAATPPASRPTLRELDTDRMPDALLRAGYYWHSATPPTIAQNGSDWRGEAPPPDQALQLAYTRERATTMIALPAVSAKDLPALLQSIRYVIAQWPEGTHGQAEKALALLRVIMRLATED